MKFSLIKTLTFSISVVFIFTKAEIAAVETPITNGKARAPGIAERLFEDEIDSYKSPFNRISERVHAQLKKAVSTGKWNRGPR